MLRSFMKLKKTRAPRESAQQRIVFLKQNPACIKFRKLCKLLGINENGNHVNAFWKVTIIYPVLRLAPKIFFR